MWLVPVRDGVYERVASVTSHVSCLARVYEVSLLLTQEERLQDRLVQR